MTRKSRHRDKRTSFDPEKAAYNARKAFKRSQAFWEEKKENDKRRLIKRALVHYAAQASSPVVKKFLKKLDIKKENDWLLLERTNQHLEEILKDADSQGKIMPSSFKELSINKESSFFF